MNKSTLKNKIGEKLYKFLILNFSDDFLSEKLPKLFFNIKELRKLQNKDYDNLRLLLNESIENKKEKKAIKRTAKELLEGKGYILDDKIERKKDYMKYSKYYKPGEKLCKFDKYNACARYHRVFWITKKNIDKIKRKDFKKPKRQDEYGSSCCSIAISNDRKNVIQLCNRYNHKVSAPDNTFNSNLDNIVVGLTEAFNQDYGLDLGNKNNVEFNDFYFINNKYYYYSHEVCGKKYSSNVIDGKYYNPDRYLIFDVYILDFKRKKITNSQKYRDSFVDIVNQKLKYGAKIEIRKGEMPKNQKDYKNKIIIYKNDN